MAEEKSRRSWLRSFRRFYFRDFFAVGRKSSTVLVVKMYVAVIPKGVPEENGAVPIKNSHSLVTVK